MAAEVGPCTAATADDVRAFPVQTCRYLVQRLVKAWQQKAMALQPDTLVLQPDTSLMQVDPLALQPGTLVRQANTFLMQVDAWHCNCKQKLG